MKEDEVKRKVEEVLEGEDFRVLKEVPVNEERDVILDFIGEKVGTQKSVLEYRDGHYISDEKTEDTGIARWWVECKGDVGMSMLLEGFIRTVYSVWHGGGLGTLALPEKQFERLKRDEEFLSMVAKTVLGRGKIQICSIINGEKMEL